LWRACEAGSIKRAVPLGAAQAQPNLASLE